MPQLPLFRLYVRFATLGLKPAPFGSDNGVVLETILQAFFFEIIFETAVDRA
jgi:hypothetical protein